MKTKIGMHHDAAIIDGDEEAAQCRTDCDRPSKPARLLTWLSKVFAARPKRDAEDVLGFTESITRSRT